MQLAVGHVVGGHDIGNVAAGGLVAEFGHVAGGHNVASGLVVDVIGGLVACWTLVVAYVACGHVGHTVGVGHVIVGQVVLGHVTAGLVAVGHVGHTVGGHVGGIGVVVVVVDVVTVVVTKSGHFSTENLNYLIIKKFITLHLKRTNSHDYFLI